MSDDARAVVERLLAGWAKAEWGSVFALFSPELHHVRVGAEDDVGILSGEWHGLEAARVPMLDYMDSWDDFRIETDELFVVDPGIVCALTRHAGKARMSGVPLDQRLADLFTVEDGLVVRWLSYWDRAAAFEAHGIDRPDYG